MKKIPVLLLGLLFIFLFSQNALSMPILDAGWEVDADILASDRILAADTNSEDSFYDYNLTNAAYFRITDYFVMGDTFKVYDYGTLILTTSFVGFSSGFGDNVSADSGWTSSNYGSGEVLLSAGAHQLSIQGDGVGGLPARFFVRLDSAPVPEPTTMVLFGIGLLGLAGVSRRKE